MPDTAARVPHKVGRVLRRAQGHGRLGIAQVRALDKEIGIPHRERVERVGPHEAHAATHFPGGFVDHEHARVKKARHAQGLGAVEDGIVDGIVVGIPGADELEAPETRIKRLLDLVRIARFEVEHEIGDHAFARGTQPRGLGKPGL